MSTAAREHDGLWQRVEQASNVDDRLGWRCSGFSAMTGPPGFASSEAHVDLGRRRFIGGGFRHSSDAIAVCILLDGHEKGGGAS